MNYQQALDYIHGTHKFGMELGLGSISRLMDLMGQPHASFRSVHVAGTNGKGSTSAFIESILREGGFRTGLFTSPYLERFTERIRVGGEEIPGEDLGEMTGYVKGFVDALLGEGRPHPTEFEIVTAIGFEYFKRKRIDYGIIEVGLGGRLDATNVITPEISVITSIGMDHTNVLGGDLTSISREKAGIIKEGIPVVLHPQSQEALEAVRKVCADKDAPLLYLGESRIDCRSVSVEGQCFDMQWRGKTLSDLNIRLLGRHQVYNAAAAAAVCLELGLSGQTVREGLKKARWPGRMEILRTSPFIMIDGAHNAQGAQALVDGLREVFPDKKILLVFGILADKEVHRITGILAPYASRVITAPPDNPRKMHPDRLREIVMQYNANVESSASVKEALKKSLEVAEEDELILFAGSLYMIGEVRRLLPPEIL